MGSGEKGGRLRSRTAPFPPFAASPAPPCASSHPPLPLLPSSVQDHAALARTLLPVLLLCLLGLGLMLASAVAAKKKRD